LQREHQTAGMRHTPKVTPQVDRAGRSPLHYAALEGRAADVAAYLQEHGDDVNLADKAAFTPLHFAAQGRHAEVARLLIEAGADLSARNRFGNTALHVALVNARDSEGEVVRVLLEAGADPDAENNYGHSARGLARRVTNYDLMRFFQA
jgi:ankyrin repeat protein